MSIFAPVRDRWGTLAPRDRRALATGVLVLLPALAWIGLVRPYLGALEQARTQLEAERSLLSREEGLLASADQLPGQLELSTQLLAEEAVGLIRVENGLLAEAELSDLVQDMASRSRVLIQEVRGVENDPEPPASGIETVRLAVRAESDLHGLAGFLNRVEGGPTLLRVLELSMEPVPSARSRDEDEPDPAQMGALSFSFIVEAYWSATPSGSVAGDGLATPRLTGIPQ